MDECMETGPSSIVTKDTTVGINLLSVSLTEIVSSLKTKVGNLVSREEGGDRA